MSDTRIKYSKLSAVALVVMGLASCGGDNGSETYTDKNAVDTTLPTADWRLIWQDEFDGSVIDSSKWNYEIDCNGGGNQEQQCYTDSADNSFVSEGMLNIVALPNTDSALSKDYTSARLNSRMKGDWKYGRFEIRAKLPAGQGAHPAMWMMPTDDVYGGWPYSGELDFVEAVNLKVAAEDGTVESNIVGTLHYGKNNGGDNNNQYSGASYVLPNDANPADDFHTYVLEWQEGEIRWYVDGYLYQTQRQSELKYNFKGEVSGLLHKGWYHNDFNNVTGEREDSWTTAPFDQRFHMILNLAVGGTWAEAVNATGIDASAFTAANALQIDYVRVYQCDIAPTTGEGCATIRAGYNEEATEERPDGALVKGAAPTPPPPPIDPNAPTPTVALFADALKSGWGVWESSDTESATPTLEIDEDVNYGDVVEFSINGSAVAGFTSREGHGVEDGTQFDASNYFAKGGTVEFDLKMTSSPGDVAWEFKVESDEAASEASLPLSASVEGHAAPVLDTWQHYTFNLAALEAQGLNPSQLDVWMIFPAWGSGDGAVFRVDNFTISAPDNGTSGPSISETIFDETNRPEWFAFDCCGGTSAAIIADDADHGDVAQFTINNHAEWGGTVVGFSTRDGHGATDGVPLDASTIVTNGTVSFDLKMTALPSVADTAWNFKIESNGGTEDGAGGQAVEVDLATNNEGHAAPELNVWQTYTFNLADLVNIEDGLDPSAIDVLMMFPAWGNGQGAVFSVDNVVIEDPTAVVTEPSSSATELVLFDSAINPLWPAWDCCAGSVPAIVTDEDATYGATVEFSIGSTATVMGFMGRDNGSVFDASLLESSGVIEFDLKLTASPGDTDWKFKVESNGGTQDGALGQDLELSLSSSNEGHAAPEVGVWQHYSFNLSDLSAAGVDISNIDVLMMYPTWDEGNGATYRVDNVRIGL